ncbi:MAG: hypothetical protein GY800_14180 [Planctomycetes bacterium]|nr:hypothetical protein [Planctomycetota bacterium]
MANNDVCSTINIKILSLPIEIVTNHKPFLKEFCSLTSAWASLANGEPPAVRFRVIHKRRYTYIEQDGRTVHRVDKDYQLCPMLIDEIRESCYQNVRDYLLFHAGAVAKNGRAILLPAKSESGKTTLTLGLMNHGYKYLTDEVAAVHHETSEVAPFQRPIYVWNWPRPLRKEVSKDFKIFRYREKNSSGTWRWQYIAPQDGTIMPKDARWKVDRIIFPRYTPGGDTVLRHIGAAQAVMALMKTSWNPFLFPDAGLRVCKELVLGASCYTLEMKDLDRACGIIEELQAQPV